MRVHSLTDVRGIQDPEDEVLLTQQHASVGVNSSTTSVPITNVSQHLPSSPSKSYNPSRYFFSLPCPPPPASEARFHLHHNHALPCPAPEAALSPTGPPAVETFIEPGGVVPPPRAKIAEASFPA